MEIIREEDIDFIKLKRLYCKVNSESIIFYNKTKLYKMFKELSNWQLRRKKTKIELLHDGGELKDVVMPKEQIVNGIYLSGYTMDNIKNSIPIFDFTSRSKSINEFLNLIYRVSLSLRTIHNDPRNIVVGDLSFSNIIIDENMKHYFVDFDSCMIDKIPMDRIPAILDDYTKKRNIRLREINQDTDKFCLMLSTLYTIFRKDIDHVTMTEFDEKAERVNTLKNMREIVLDIKKNGNKIPNVPYIDEVIAKSTLSTKKRIKVANQTEK